jgi:hypothetical protein
MSDWTVQDAKTLTKGTDLRIKLGNRGLRLERRTTVKSGPFSTSQWVLVTKAFYNQVGHDPLSIRGTKI